ncbi:ankyrin repeat domain-containing protein 12 isoform X2 [Apis cerana]|uniref:ankyrin repeat domain-containing protein 12 isoform X2 n=1 Tax=Apis cerana TaxID=7461 RepID=UPI002B22508F|nr:ankyrin repeat domain-containing protein 12 isoform X2 [Apis cerana]
MSYEDGMPAGGNSRFRGYPARMSERQQLALLLQMTSQEIVSGGNRTENTNTSNTTSRSSSLQQRGSKGRWTSKNGESAVQASINRKEDFRMRQMLVNGYDLNTKETNVDRSGTGQSGSSPRVTLRLNQVRGARDEKKGGGTANSRQGGMNAQNQGQMETSSKTSSNVSSGTVNAVSGSSTSGNTSSTSDSSDVYEFKSSKEPTPVRGASSSPNPNPEKDKDGNKSVGNQGGQNGGNNVSTANSATSSGETTTASITTDDAPAVSASPSSKRAFENDNTEEQDEENRRKKRKDSEPIKENLKNTTTGRQSTSRNTTNTVEKCTKSGKQGSGTNSSKNNQNTTSISTDRKSPSSSMASSPKPSNPSGSTTNSKTTTPAPPESDGEDDRSKGSDSNSAPKVPPLKIVIPQSTASEQEQGNRNGKSTSNRSHQLPYVVASSNSNDSTDKDQNQSTSGTTSPTESGNNTKNEDKKDFSGALHGEERSTHHQRVLRSSHRSGNGNNGSMTLKENSSSTGNGNYSNSSPLPVSSTDRSNNSSPQQRHHSPTPENTNSESNKNTSTEISNSGITSKTNIMTEKSEKNTETGGKCQKDSGAENSENASTTTSSTTANIGTPAPPVELHPRKRKMKPNKEAQQAATAASNEASEATNTGPEVHPHDQPITNCYQLFLNIRKQIERRRKGLFPVQPKPPQGFKDYLMNRCTYVLAGNANKEPNVNPPVGLQGAMKDLYIEQEKERYRLRMQHVVEKEKLVLSVEQEILRVHGRAARALANQSLPFSVCTILKDEEVYNVITPEQEEKDRNARSRYNGRLFLSWLQDVDDKWEKIKEAMLLRHHNEAESLHAVQRMDWEWKLKEVGLCEFKATPQIEDIHVPMVHVSDDFDLLPA